MIAYAQEVANVVQVVEPTSVDGAISFVSVLVEAYRNGNYLLAGAALTVLIVFILRKYVMPKLKIGPGSLPILSALIGMFAGVGLAIVNGAPAESAVMAVLSGPLASVFWSGLLKYGFKK